MNTRRVCIITGASSGIGMETALAYARRGDAVVLAARRAEKLQEVAQRCRQLQGGAADDGALVVPTDVSQERQVEALVDATLGTFGRVDVMVNNAGFGQFGRVWEVCDADLRAIFDVNFFGAFYGCRAVAPVMICQRSGHIFNISSVIGKVGSPFHGAYAASKFALSGLTESLRVELKPYGVHVTNVCPALTATEFFDNVRNGAVRSRSDFLGRSRKMPASKVARRIVGRTGKRTPQMVFTWGGWLLIRLAALWPRAADAIIKVYHDDLIRAAAKHRQGTS